MTRNKTRVTKHQKPKLTKQERRDKYTKLARQRRERKVETTKQSRLVCFACRQQGHVASNCPNSTCQTKKVCFKCGSTEHTLYQCPKKGRELQFATCFCCGKMGHLASACPANQNGIYVNGGSCRTCGSNQHLATACPERKKEHKTAIEEKEEDVEHLLEQDTSSRQTKPETNTKKKKRVVKF